MSKKRIATTSSWAPLPRPRFTPGQTAAIVVRHLVPLAGVLFLHWSAAQFLLLCVFNIGFTLACIACIGVSVSERKQARPDAGLANVVAGWATLVAVGVAVTLGLTALFGWVIGLSVDWNASLAWGALTTIVFATPGVVAQYRFDLASSMSEAERRQRDQPNVMVLVLCAGALFLFSGYIQEFGRYGLVIGVAAASALFIFRDLRPDLMRELARTNGEPP